MRVRAEDFLVGGDDHIHAAECLHRICGHDTCASAVDNDFSESA